MRLLALLAHPTLGLAFIAQIPKASTRYLSSPLSPRQVSPDGSCGGSTGYTCSTGNCCSQYGYWCEPAFHLLSHSSPIDLHQTDSGCLNTNSGSSDSFCGTGCQPSYGSCGIPSSPPPDGSCGGANAINCTNGLCCSQYGYWYASFFAHSIFSSIRIPTASDTFFLFLESFL